MSADAKEAAFQQDIIDRIRMRGHIIEPQKAFNEEVMW